MKGIYLLLMETQAHVAENGAPPDKFGVLYCLLYTDSMVLTARSMFHCYYTLVPGCREGMGPFKHAFHI